MAMLLDTIEWAARYATGYRYQYRGDSPVSTESPVKTRGSQPGFGTGDGDFKINIGGSLKAPGLRPILFQISDIAESLSP
eukprot:1338638-Amorphochlora_amoeboformis.AAC.2